MLLIISLTGLFKLQVQLSAGDLDRTPKDSVEYQN